MNALNNHILREPQFSFCIPTRNRATFLVECLESILAQDQGDIEVVIVDGASTDNTQDVIDKYKERFGRIRSVQRQETFGVDLDILLAVNLAQGQYCWLMSDDDRLELGALDYIRKAIRTHEGLTGISVNIRAYDKELRYEIKALPSVSGNQLKADYLFTDRASCFSLLGVHFGFISGQIVNRAEWNSAIAGKSLDEFCNAWILVYVIGRMLRAHQLRWLYVNERLVSYRSGNDSFVARLGIYGRQLIAHVNFEFTVRELFGKGSKVYQNVLGTLVKDRMPRNLAVIKANGCDYAIQAKLLMLYIRQYRKFPAFWIKVFPLFFVPNFVFRTVRGLYFIVRSNIGFGSAK